MTEILTERTRIVPYVKAHIPDILKMFKEPDSNRFIRPLLNQTDEQYLEILNTNLTKNDEVLQLFSVYAITSNEFVGTMNLNVFKLTGHNQIGLHLSRKFWNQGYGKELCTALLEFAKNGRKMEVIHWVFEEGHEVSKKLAVCLGFEPFTEAVDGDLKVKIYRLILNPQ